MNKLSRKNFLMGGSCLMAAAALGMGTAFAEEAEAAEAKTFEMDPVEKLIAKDEITEQINKYAHAVDRLDAEMGYSVFTEDSELDYGESIYRGTGRGFIDWCIQAHLNMVRTCHRMLNVMIHFDSPTEAHSQTYSHCNMILRIAEDGTATKLGADCRYLDKWVKGEDGVWRIAKRDLATDWNDMETVTITAAPNNSERCTLEGEKADPFYAFFPEYK